jgi:hypothetical protein
MVKLPQYLLARMRGLSTPRTPSIEDPNTVPPMPAKTSALWHIVHGSAIE